MATKTNISASPAEATRAAVDEARDGVLAARTAVQQWQGKADAADRETADLESTAGERILADPEAAEAIESRLTVLRSLSRAARRGLDATAPTVVAAESLYLTAEAALLDLDVAAAADVLAQHQAETDRLLMLLEAHEGRFMCQSEARDRVARANAGALVLGAELPASPAPKSRALAARVAKLSDRVEVLRELAAGRDPREWWKANRPGTAVDYPDCLTRPGALVTTPEHRDRLQSLKESISGIQAAQVELSDEIKSWQVRRDQGTDLGAAATAIARLEARLEELPGELQDARATLAALAGPPVDVTPTGALEVSPQ